MFSTAIALAVIISGHDSNPSCNREALYAVASELELLDDRELKWWGKPWTGFEATDVQLLHKRYEQLHDAPPACDAVRFPDRDVCADVIGFNRQYISFLEQRKKLFHDGWIDDAIADASRIISIYDTVRDCRCDYYYITTRRESLAKLRGLLGAWDYYQGTLPPVLPVWYFRRID